MATTDDLKKLGQDLHDKTFLLGGFRRKAAVKALAERRNDPKATALLLEALAIPGVAEIAAAALRDLHEPAAVDFLCAEATRSPKSQVAQLCVERKYRPAETEKAIQYFYVTRQIEELCELRNDPKATALLLEALAIPGVAEIAAAALRDLHEPAAVDFLCAEATRSPKSQVAQLCVERKYRPAETEKAIQYFYVTRQIEELCELRNDPKATALLLDALNVPEISELATAALRDLKATAAIDFLCKQATREPQGRAAKLCVERKYRPSDHEQACLFLFVTRQLDEYFKEDFEFQNLRLHYDRADEKLRALVMDVVRGGDRRCLPFITRPRKALHECTEEEIKLALKSCLRHKDWNRLFKACLELPAKYSFPAWDRFRASDWQPDDPALASLYKQILADSAGQTVESPSPPKATSGVFERWLAEGRKPELAKLAEGELVNRLKAATPPEGVPLVAALATQSKCEAATIKAVAENEHWLVRLAGLATGLTKDIVRDGQKDSNYWVNELAGTAGVLEFWPGKATPADLDRLKNAPAEAYAGKLGAVRKVLRTIMGYRVTTGSFEELQVQAGETDAEFIIAE